MCVSRKFIARFICVLTVLAVTAAVALAQPADKRTVFTFSGPVALPGVTLPAGQYLFRLADPTTSGKVVQVLSGDGRTPYAMLFTMAAERPEPVGTPEVRFMETAAGMPAAIKTWWYPGERRGFEFVYPKEQARRLARGASQPVLTTQAQTTTAEQTNTQDLTRLSSGGQESNVRADATPVSAMPAGIVQAGEIASSSLAISTPVVPTIAAAVNSPQPTPGSAPAAAATRMASARTSLPKTAGQEGSIALLGATALCAGLGLLWKRGGPKAA